MAAENDTDQEQEPTRFELDGVGYEMPELRDLDIDEWMIVYKYSKVVLRDLMEITDDPEAEQARVDKLEQPGVMKALFHIAYKRAHPKKTDAAVEALVGQIKYLPTLEAMNPGSEEASEEEDPTEETTEPGSEPSEPELSSLRSSDSQSGNGSSASTTSSETPEEEPAPTGMSG